MPCITVLLKAHDGTAAGRRAVAERRSRPATGVRFTEFEAEAPPSRSAGLPAPGGSTSESGGEDSAERSSADRASGQARAQKPTLY